MDPLRYASKTEMNEMAAKRKSFPSLSHRNHLEMDDDSFITARRRERERVDFFSLLYNFVNFLSTKKLSRVVIKYDLNARSI